MTTATYYFNAYDVDGEEWPTTPANFVDGSLDTKAEVEVATIVQLLTGNTCDGTDLGAIASVNLRLWAAESTNTRYVLLRPVFGGSSDGDDHTVTVNYQPPAHQFPDVDITTDTNAPGSWAWTDVQNLDCDAVSAGNNGTIYGYKLEIVVVYGASDVLAAADITTGAPTLSAPVLENGISVCTAADITLGTPTLGSPVLALEPHHLTAQNITTGTPTLLSPILDDGTDQPLAGLASYTDTIGAGLASYTDSAGAGLASYTDSAGAGLASYTDSAGAGLASYTDVIGSGLSS